MVDVHLVGYSFTDYVYRVDDLRNDGGAWLEDHYQVRHGGICTLVQHLPELLVVEASRALARAIVLTDGINKKAFTRFCGRVNIRPHSARWCHIAYLDQVRPTVDEVRRLREVSDALSCDLVDVPADDEFVELMRLMDYQFVSEELYTRREAFRGLRDGRPTDVRLVHGPGGCAVEGRTTSPWFPNPHVRDVSNNIGAGDIFAARVIGGLLTGQPLSDAIPAAHEYTARVLGERS